MPDFPLCHWKNDPRLNLMLDTREEILSDNGTTQHICKTTKTTLPNGDLEIRKRYYDRTDQRVAQRRNWVPFGISDNDHVSYVSEEEVFMDFITPSASATQKKESDEMYYGYSSPIKDYDKVIAELLYFREQLREEKKEFEKQLAAGNLTYTSDNKIKLQPKPTGWSARARLKAEKFKKDDDNAPKSFADRFKKGRGESIEEPEWKRTLFIDNLPLDYGPRDIAELVAGFGRILRINIVKDRDTGESLGKAFAVLTSEKLVLEAIEAVSGTKLGHSVVHIQQAHEKK
jgi:cold-inducible RNA-binding protein